MLPTPTARLSSATSRAFNSLNSLNSFNFFLLTAQRLTEAVLECFAVSAAHDTLVDDAETELMTIFRRTVSCQR